MNWLKSIGGWCLTITFLFSAGGHLVYRSETILAISVGGYVGNIPEKFELH